MVAIKKDPKQEIADLKKTVKKLKAELKARDAKCIELYEKIANLRLAQTRWYGFNEETLKRLGLGCGPDQNKQRKRVKLVSAMATINAKTGQIETPVLEQIQTLPPFGPMIRAAMEVFAIAEYVFQTIEPPKPERFGAYRSWVESTLHNLAYRILNTVPHVYQPGKEKDDFRMFNGKTLRHQDVKENVLEAIDNATDVIAYRLKKQYQEEVG